MRRQAPPRPLCYVRAMNAADVAAVAALGRDDSEYARDAATLHAMLGDPSVVAHVATRHGLVLGYCCHEPHARRLNLLDLCVAGGARRTGVGAALIARLVARLSAKRPRIVAEVRESALGSHLFLRAMGFTATRVLRGYFDDSGEDAYRFVFERDERLVIAESEVA